MKQEGFSLTEVLISILVLAVGVVGAASMQLTALRTSRQSAHQTVALELAIDMADRIRANDAAIGSAGGESAFNGIDFNSNEEPVTTQTFCEGSKAKCDARQMAIFDIHDWEMRLKAALPFARAVICRDAKPWDNVTRSYKWQCDNAAPGQTSLPFAVKIGWQAVNKGGDPAASGVKRFSPAIVILVGQAG